ncbi:hypothetical protein EDC01DRAFT_757670 [Geopyxis carbonaria]|nr:hypothetical protein EDC01DRAFT_757670 [Geopyxis carbonaria]
MARKARQRISYVLPLANSPGGHRLGVNSVAVDGKGILYTAGRDGAICSWTLGVDLAQQNTDEFIPRLAPAPSVFRNQIQAHTHWVNDIVLADENQALVSCSSDLTVKIWRPFSQTLQADTIGVHSDYVKCLAAPGGRSNWVASGGLDRKIKFWDLNGGGETLQIDVGNEGNNPKGSIYSLGVGGGILASGGPESVVRVWDPRSGKRITKFVGHTDNIRSILVSDQGNLVLTASSDTTIKLWSLTAGRCLHTLSMHNDSVWSLCSSQPGLEIFHSSDRSGLVAKTDVRNVAEIDEGICVAVCQEKEGVNKVVASGDYIWTSTSSSSINRWMDVDTNTGVGTEPRRPRLSTSSAFPSNVRDPDAVTVYSMASARQASMAETLMETDMVTVPMNDMPDETIEGQHGLMRHFLLNDRRRVLTVDTAGEVVMWDLLKCVPTKSFGKRHLEDVAAEINTVDSIANWCQVDTRTGRLACVLEENYCFDAEMYADAAELGEGLEFKDDQRINLGKWVLRYLFSNLIDQEIIRDEDYRKKLESERQERDRFGRDNAPGQISLPPPTLSIQDSGGPRTGGSAVVTPLIKPSNGGYLLFPPTPGLGIGLATPAPLHNSNAPPLSPNTLEDNGNRSSIERQGDYFSAPPKSGPSLGEACDDLPSTPTAEKEKEEKDSSLFGKWRSFGTKKLGRSASTDMGSKPPLPTTDEKSSDQAVAEEPAEKPNPMEDTLLGVVNKMRQMYGVHLREHPDEPLSSGITPSLPNETPVLKPPHNTTIIVQEDKPDSGGVADLYRGTVGCVGQDVDLLETVAPAWLGDLLLQNRIPFKDTVKISFVLVPWKDELPVLPSESGRLHSLQNEISLALTTSSEGKNSRLNANRMLRAKKIMAYIAEHLQPPFMTNHGPEFSGEGEQPKAEDWLELVCHDQIVPITMTLSTMRSYLWKTGGDVVLYYRRKQSLIDSKEASGTPTDGPLAGEGSHDDNEQRMSIEGETIQ